MKNKKFLLIALCVVVLLCVVILLVMTSHGNKGENVNHTSNSKVELTVDNILKYVQFDGEFTDGKYTKSIVNWAEAVLEFQAYPVVSGKFNNVEITLVATSNDHTFTYMNSLGNYWHLSDADKDTKKIEFTFKLSVDGRFSKNYSVECLNNTGKLSGSSDFKIVSVSGTFLSD